ncbi:MULTISPECIES: MFS transporter [unclassified Beijerinckia]|uniref:MFS transporter n=1 Tax=unclassified Beijerinckia TaxID=2638183 RepID=UPI000898B1D5|nr:MULTISPECIES: MFS transporter [unclassified Beijerinckia]MDH7795701.1 MFS family permease [Beijerinckia sp. GAS462]SEC12459.1 Predicted arabinose efflux permease, MFS family [Beijerinckia sp. 28-YEA-48]
MGGQKDEAAVAAGFIDARARVEFIAICLVGFFFSFTNNYSSLLAIVFERSGHSLPDAGLLLSLFAIPAILAALLSSAACARIGVLPTIRVAIFLTMIGMGSFAFTRESFWLSLLSRLVQGAGVGLFLPAAMVYSQSRINRKRFVYFITVFSAVVPLAAIAPPIGAWTLERYGFASLFAEAALPSALAIALTYALRMAQRPNNTGGLNLGAGLQRRLLLPYATVMIGGLLYGYSTSYLAADLHERTIALAAFFVPSSISLVAMRFAAMRVLAAVALPILVAASLGTYALGFALIALASGPLVMIAGALAYGIGNSIMLPVVAAWVVEGLEPQDRSGPQAVNISFFYFGLYATPWPIAHLIGAVGYVTTEWVIAAIAVAMMAVVLAFVMRPARAGA